MFEGYQHPLIRVVSCALALLAFVAGTVPASSAVTGKRASILVDANTGRVLHAKQATALRYPASLTKMMTLYMVFERIADGSLRHDSMIVASRKAAAQPPSKLGLRTGDRITVAQAIKALVTKSANDVAAAVAEHIGGSEAAFAAMMTRKARALGMSRTTFRNASGLPNRSQVTTARDMAQLALRLRDHFPRQFRHFRTRKFTYKNRTYRNHNGLLGRYRGVDGIKTGYTRASGFNLVSSVKHNGRDVVAVVMGGRTGRARNAQMRKLLSRYVPRASARRTRKRHVRFALRRPPKRIAYRRSTRRNRPARSAAVSRPRVARNIRAAAPVPATRTVRGTPPGTLQAQAARLHARRGYQPRALGGQLSRSTHHIQVGAFYSPTEAHRQLSLVTNRSGRLLSGARPVAIRASTGARAIFRARYAGFDASSATATCNAMRQRQIDCFVTRAP